MPMSNEDFSTLFDEMLARKIRPRDVIKRLVAAGHYKGDAEEHVFISLGGSDIVEIGSDGVGRYTSGRTVPEVEADWKERDRAR